jgi:hydrogenase maturation protein HypF
VVAIKVAKMVTLRGLVQGIGMRPFIYRLAKQTNVAGNVQNAGGCVRIAFEGEEEDAAVFLGAIGSLERSLPLARIDEMQIQETRVQGFADFTIMDSARLPDDGMIAPDYAMCPDCEAELYAGGRRHQYYFNNCTSCGPRFSIIRALPYDRVHTSMASFSRCAACGAEYTDPADRRFHAQAICCPDCGPTLCYQAGDGLLRSGDDAYQAAVDCLQAGQVLLIKGIGGYHLACSPYDATAVERVRNIKKRYAKPFAVMFKNLEEIEAVCLVDDSARQALRSVARPIVLLPLKGEVPPFAPQTLNGSQRCGCFLPYAPLQQLLLDQTGALVMTSANVSGSPIVYNDDEALRFFEANKTDIAGILYHDRVIVRPVEDSVVQIACGKAVTIRRGRGYVPQTIDIGQEGELLALGGDLKASFCLTKQGKAYVSQYFGDLADVGVFERFEAGIADFEKLFRVKPKLVVCDLHPGYHSSQYAQELGASLLYVQHHHAHVVSVMAEHRLMRTIGVAFDGTGYGEDGAIWGGEFLVCEGESYRRALHLGYVRLLGGDEGARDAGLTAACYDFACGQDLSKGMAKKYPGMDDLLRSGLGHLSSSMGRLFDAVCALLGICEYNTYEAQCAIALQERAEIAQARNIQPILMQLPIKNDELVFSDVIEKALSCTASDADAFALGFHMAVADAVANAAALIRTQTGIEDVALSGGVFQNTLLLSMCDERLKSRGFRVAFNEDFPPNDGGIALGQALIGGYRMNKRSE